MDTIQTPICTWCTIAYLNKEVIAKKKESLDAEVVTSPGVDEKILCSPRSRAREDSRPPVLQSEHSKRRAGYPQCFCKCCITVDCRHAPISHVKSRSGCGSGAMQDTLWHCQRPCSIVSVTFSPGVCYCTSIAGTIGSGWPRLDARHAARLCLFLAKASLTASMGA